MRNTLRWALVFIATLVGCALSASAGIIYSGTFPGDAATALNGSIPSTVDNTGGEIGASPSWIAASTANDFKANGSINNTAAFYAAAYLPFVPNIGNIYTLSATLNDTTVANRFFAIGFTETSAVPTTTGGRMLDLLTATTPGSVGHAWMLHRGGGYNGTTFDQIFVGPGTGGGSNIAAPLGQITHAVDVQILLDTRPALWTATWKMRDHNNPADPYTTVGGPMALGAASPTINYIGLNVANQVAGQVSNLQLELTVPEPASFVSMAMLGVAFLRRSRV